MIFLNYEEKNIIFKLKKKLMVENFILTVFFWIFKFFFRFFLFKKIIFKTLKMFLIFNYMDCHVLDVARSTTATWQITCHIIKNVKPESFPFSSLKKILLSRYLFSSKPKIHWNCTSDNLFGWHLSIQILFSAMQP